MKEQYKNNNHQIQDPVLAEHVAHAEKPSVEAGLQDALEGRFNSVSDHFTEATRLGRLAGAVYLHTKKDQVEADRTKLGIPEVAFGSELEKKAELAKILLADRYNLTTDDFSLLQYRDDEGNLVNTVVLSTPVGIDMGDQTKYRDKKRSYKSIMSSDKENQEAHTIEIDGVSYDDRVGMTRGLYNALQESYTLHRDDSWTMLTGEPLDEDEMVTFYVKTRQGAISRLIQGVEYDYPNMAFRPTVVL